MKILNLHKDDTGLIRQAAALLVEGFKDTGSASWPDMAAGLKEIEESLQPGRISLAAIDDTGEVVGWVSGISEYDGNAWELHGLVVKTEYRGRGIARALVAELENQVMKSGGTTIYLGTDDENCRTSVSGIDLYPDVLEKLANIKNPGNHPFGFYQKVGFTVVGIIRTPTVSESRISSWLRGSGINKMSKTWTGDVECPVVQPRLLSNRFRKFPEEARDACLIHFPLCC